jgi:lysozyme
MSIEAALPAAVDLAKRWEGLHRVVVRKPKVEIAPYVCPAGILTIGYGHTGTDVVPGMRIDEWRAQELLYADMRKALADAVRYCPGLLAGPPLRLAAIGDFVFNLGGGRLKASTLRRKINAGEWADVPAELRKWVWGGGKKLPGLILRREAEIVLLGEAE